jgi:peptidoglycan/xylan/chitin deacetylase (PgdA/CDA1 family)
VATDPSPRPVPIFVYHNIAHPPRGARLTSLYVPPEQFARQMRLLRALGIQGVTMSEALPYLAGEKSGRVAAITLDDGYADHAANALPALERYGMRATCYVTSGALGAYNFWDADRLNAKKPIMSEAQLRAWADAGMEVGAHSRTHPHLTELPPEEAEAEVRGCKDDLEERVGREVTQFCYPYGAHDARLAATVRSAGFTAATTLRRGRARSSDDPYLLPRVLVRERDPIGRFLLKLITPYEDYRGRADARR